AQLNSCWPGTIQPIRVATARVCHAPHSVAGTGSLQCLPYTPRRPHSNDMPCHYQLRH
ncbi:hypothetical protein PanWU01x14_114490, partial [Parasponia andersonii]